MDGYAVKLNSVLWESRVNMTNCYKQSEHFFQKYKSINLKVLIGFWMQEGYLGPIYSAEQAQRKGYDLLLELINIRGMLRFSGEGEEMIELVSSTDSVPIRCRHEGLCAPENLGLVDLDKIGDAELTDGMPKKKKGSVDLTSPLPDYQFTKFNPSKSNKLKYMANLNPRPNTLKPLLLKIKKPSAMLFRGCEGALQADFPFEKFRALTAVEISGLSHLPSWLQKAICNLTQLESLNLSDIPVEPIGIEFSQLKSLRRLTLRGSCHFDPGCLEGISQLAQLQYLNLSHLLIKKLPHDFFYKLVELRWVILRSCSELLSLPTIKPLGNLEMLDLCHCSSLGFAFVPLENSHLQTLDISYTSMYGIPTLRGTPNLTQLILKGSRARVFDSLDQLSVLQVLDLSGARNMMRVNQLVGKTNLLALDLSWSGITSIEFLSDLIHLRYLMLQGCCLLKQLPAMKKLKSLEKLDVSGCLYLAELPEDLGDLKGLKELNLSGCCRLDELREGLFDQMSCLVKLNLSKTKFIHLPSFDKLVSLKELDLFKAKVNHLPSFASLVNLRKLSLRDLELDSIETLSSLSNLVHLDLQGLKVGSSLQELKLDFLESLQSLETLNLSQTSVETLPDISQLVNLKELSLANCRKLKAMPHLQTLTNMETLDLHLGGFYIFDNLQGEETELEFLSAPSNLRKLVLANRPGVLKLFPLTSLASLEYLDIRQNHEIDYVTAHLGELENLEPVSSVPEILQGRAQERTSKPDEFHLISTFYESGFDRFETEFPQLNKLISDIQTMFTSAKANNQVFKRHFPKMLSDLKYLLENINLLKISHNSKSIEELLHELMDAATLPSAYDFSLDSTNFNVLHRLVLKLKLLLPAKQLEDSEGLEVAKKESKLQFKRSKSEEEVVRKNVLDPDGRQVLLNSYESLTDINKQCLLCFSVFPCSEGGRDENTGALKSRRVVIKKRMLIHWWVGEGFIHPEHDNNTSAAKDRVEQQQDWPHEWFEMPEDDTSTTTPPTQLEPEACGIWGVKMYIPLPRVSIGRVFRTGPKEKGGGREGKGGKDDTSSAAKDRAPQQQDEWSEMSEDDNTSAAKDGVPQPQVSLHEWSKMSDEEMRLNGSSAGEQVATEKTGKAILKTLEEKGFIVTVMNKGRDSGSCCMEESVHSLVTEWARASYFFDIDQENRQSRACMLKSHDNFLSSCKLWAASYTGSPTSLESFSLIHALLNVNDPVIDIRPEWFRKMKDLVVLHLGSWGFQNNDRVEVLDQKFFEDLKSMKQLRLLSLQGFSAITNITDSVCKLTNLRILNLRECSYLEELPAEIGSLKSLIHLDLTHCRLLSMCPKGVRLLSKLEVLKGFVINYKGGGRQHRKACVLGDLLKLEMLNKLSLVVNIDKFPSMEDLQVFKEMRSLRNLKITWEASDNMSQEARDANAHDEEAITLSSNSRWKRLKCWGSQENAPATASNHHLLDNLRKLVLCCFPLETTPDWLDPSELENLEKLYIVGGRLKDLQGGWGGEWNVKILRLRYLRNMVISWVDLRRIFKKITYLENHQCDKLTRFPCDDEGVWIREKEP